VFPQSAWLSDEDDRLKHLGAGELRQLTAALAAAAELLDQHG
jgi:hypothetical protein